jgi:nitrogen fixation/metabolism regulation signal transduction histidine kinase
MFPPKPHQHFNLLLKFAFNLAKLNTFLMLINYTPLLIVNICSSPIFLNLGFEIYFKKKYSYAVLLLQTLPEKIDLKLQYV